LTKEELVLAAEELLDQQNKLTEELSAYDLTLLDDLEDKLSSWLLIAKDSWEEDQ